MRRTARSGAAGALLGDLGDVIDETHVEHAIRFVEHQGVQRIKVQIAPVQVIDHTAGRAHDHVRAVLKARVLAAQRNAAGQGHHLDVVFRTRQAANLGRHLIGQLAGGAEHQALHREIARIQLGQQRQGKGCGLAAAGLRLGDHILAFKRRGQAGELNRRHFKVAEPLKIGERRRRKRKFVEGMGEAEGAVMAAF